MKIILWVEDATDDICTVFDDFPGDFPDNNLSDVSRKEINDCLLEKYHIHRVTNLSDALTAVGERDYDYYLLDVKFPENKKKDIKSQKIIDDFVEHDRNENSFNEMKAGQYLFMHLLPKTDIDQIRIYSGNIKHTDYLKEWAMSSELSLNWDEIIFSKSVDSKASAKEVKEWLKGIPSDERILRHAMIEGCNDLLKTVNNKTSRTIYAKSQQYGKANIVDENKIKQHILLIKQVVVLAGRELSNYDAKSYHALLIMIITSECQEYLSQDSKQNLDEDYKKLAGTLTRIRNLFQHHQKMKEDQLNAQFIAMVFMIYTRSMSNFGDDLKPFECYLLTLFAKKLKNIEEPQYRDDVNKVFSERCKILIPPNWYKRKHKGYKLKDSENWVLCGEKKNGKWCYVTKNHTFQDLLENHHFINERSFQYNILNCYQLFMVNFFDFKQHSRCSPSATFDNSTMKWKIIPASGSDNESSPNDHWSDEYCKAFYTVAFPAPNE